MRNTGSADVETETVDSGYRVTKDLFTSRGAEVKGEPSTAERPANYADSATLIWIDFINGWSLCGLKSVTLISAFISGMYPAALPTGVL